MRKQKLHVFSHDEAHSKCESQLLNLSLLHKGQFPDFRSPEVGISATGTHQSYAIEEHDNENGHYLFWNKVTLHLLSLLTVT